MKLLVILASTVFLFVSAVSAQEKAVPPSLSEIRTAEVVNQWEGKYWLEISCSSGKKMGVKENTLYLYEKLRSGHTVVWRVRDDRKKRAVPAFVVSPDMTRQYWYWASKDDPANFFPFVSNENTWTVLNGVNSNGERMSTGGYYSSKVEDQRAGNGVLRKVVQKYPHSTSAMWDVELSVLTKDDGRWYVVNKKHAGYFSSGECADLYSFNLLEEVKN